MTIFHGASDSGRIFEQQIVRRGFEFFPRLQVHGCRRIIVPGRKRETAGNAEIRQRNRGRRRLCVCVCVKTTSRRVDKKREERRTGTD